MWILLAVVAFIDSLVRLRAERDDARADIEVQQKRRYDSIPWLIEIVKGHALHETGMRGAVVRSAQSSHGGGGEL